jgi:predicted lipase
VTGHSLGGALATHAAVHLVNEGVTVSEFYTFGCPRVGDVKFSNWFDAFIKSNSKFRITHGRDPVPHLPPEGFGFKHTPHEIFYKGFVREGYVTCNDNGSK